MLLIEFAIAISGYDNLLQSRIIDDVENVVPFVPQLSTFLCPNFLFHNAQNVRTLRSVTKHIIQKDNFILAVGWFDLRGIGSIKNPSWHIDLLQINTFL